MELVTEVKSVTTSKVGNRNRKSGWRLASAAPEKLAELNKSRGNRIRPGPPTSDTTTIDRNTKKVGLKRATANAAGVISSIHPTGGRIPAVPGSTISREPTKPSSKTIELKKLRAVTCRVVIVLTDNTGTVPWW